MQKRRPSCPALHKKNKTLQWEIVIQTADSYFCLSKRVAPAKWTSKVLLISNSIIKKHVTGTTFFHFECFNVLLISNNLLITSFYSGIHRTIICNEALLLGVDIFATTGSDLFHCTPTTMTARILMNRLKQNFLNETKYQQTALLEKPKQQSSSKIKSFFALWPFRCAHSWTVKAKQSCSGVFVFPVSPVFSSICFFPCFLFRSQCVNTACTYYWRA